MQWGARVVIYSLSLILGRTSAAGRGGLSFKSRWRGRQRQRVDNVYINLPRGRLSNTDTNSLVFLFVLRLDLPKSRVDLYSRWTVYEYSISHLRYGYNYDIY